MKNQHLTETDFSMNRRKFLNRFWAFFGVAAAAQFGWLGVSFMNSRRARHKPAQLDRIITAGPLERFTPETVTAIPSGRFYLACLADGGLLALSRTCTHLGCSVPWDEDRNKFICPCHGSTFNLAGEVISPPAPRPLDIFPVRIENGIVKVNIAMPRRRERFDPSQAARL
jgi:cytochrome b6-f complex iron-sulfur subunit